MGKRKNLADGFPTRLRELRKHRGLSQSQLADLADLSQPTIAGYESKLRRPDIKTLETIAACLGAAPCWLAYGIGENPLPLEFTCD
jgi:transcriptional regulator with XRE-family HTH domain